MYRRCENVRLCAVDDARKRKTDGVRTQDNVRYTLDGRTIEGR